MVKVQFVQGGQEEINAFIAMMTAQGGTYRDLIIIDNNNSVVVYEVPAGSNWLTSLFK